MNCISDINQASELKKRLEVPSMLKLCFAIRGRCTSSRKPVMSELCIADLQATAMSAEVLVSWGVGGTYLRPGLADSDTSMLRRRSM